MLIVVQRFAINDTNISVYARTIVVCVVSKKRDLQTHCHKARKTSKDRGLLRNVNLAPNRSFTKPSS